LTLRCAVAAICAPLAVGALRSFHSAAEVPVAAAATEPPPPAPAAPPATLDPAPADPAPASAPRIVVAPPPALPLELVATVVARDPAASVATIRRTGSPGVGGYRVGDAIGALGVVERIAATHVEVRAPGASAPTRVRWAGRGSSASSISSRSASVAAAAPGTTPSLTDGIRRVGDDRYEVDRSLIDQLTANPAMIRGAVAMPSTKGLLLSRVRPGSPFAAIGLHSGDTVTDVNGRSLRSPDEMLDAYAALKNASTLTVTVDRKGQTRTLQYAIR
jgi:general secretion pathway protein C